MQLEFNCVGNNEIGKIKLKKEELNGFFRVSHENVVKQHEGHVSGADWLGPWLFRVRPEFLYSVFL